jgi:hypothetical protein
VNYKTVTKLQKIKSSTKEKCVKIYTVSFYFCFIYA